EDALQNVRHFPEEVRQRFDDEQSEHDPRPLTQGHYYSGLPPGKDPRRMQIGPGTQMPNLAMDDLTPAARRTQTPNLAMDDFVNLDGMAPATGPQYRIDPTATPLQTPTGGNRGVYTGETATAPAGAQPTGAQAP